MKKILLLILTMVLAFAFAACGSERYEKSTITINKNYSVEAAYVSDFDQETYNTYLLEKEVKELVAQYNTKAESKNVSLESLDVENNEAYVVMKFKTVLDYSRFSEEEMYAGLLSDALNSGDIDVNAEIFTIDGKLATTISQVCNDERASKYKVLMITGTYDIKIKGKAVYKSQDINIDSEGNISVDTFENAYLIYE